MSNLAEVTESSHNSLTVEEVIAMQETTEPQEGSEDEETEEGAEEIGEEE